MSRPDSPIHIILPGDDPESAANNANLKEALGAGRQVVAFWHGEGEGSRPKIVLLLGPVPGARAPSEVDRWKVPQIVGALVAVAIATPFLIAWVRSYLG